MKYNNINNDDSNIKYMITGFQKCKDEILSTSQCATQTDWWYILEAVCSIFSSSKQQHHKEKKELLLLAMARKTNNETHHTYSGSNTALLHLFDVSKRSQD
uniref:Uncharacterized protein n=1 Tax=Heterosigma akashiwo TaxID=2829 RepID=A0A6S9HV39_HETAK|mmetsp:Transcript_11520/g.16095  ORF Transcript_11520/g.16095 Transcript_11520/m.16095 type:complete len:101 (-) Transcript_11520:778-1080(-)